MTGVLFLVQKNELLIYPQTHAALSLIWMVY